MVPFSGEITKEVSREIQECEAVIKTLVIRACEPPAAAPAILSGDYEKALSKCRKGTHTYTYHTSCDLQLHLQYWLGKFVA